MAKPVAAFIEAQKIIKIFFEKLAYFSAPKNHHPTHHVSPRIHHNFTTNHQHKNTTFPKPPLKTPAKRSFAPPQPSQYFFLRSKYPPAEPGAFKCEPLEAAYAGSLTRPRLV
jgi:hypothetical protein